MSSRGKVMLELSKDYRRQQVKQISDTVTKKMNEQKKEAVQKWMREVQMTGK